MLCFNCQTEFDSRGNWRKKYCGDACRDKALLDKRRASSLRRYHQKLKFDPFYKESRANLKERLRKDPEWQAKKKLADKKYYLDNKDLIKKRSSNYKKTNKARVL